ncbi:hypothetical protein [Kitasatospora phosalacinea]|uniref:Uncharacterized protein n=1 Tax=Kitasatospora phosalacinea TaxID=2065 RepID=A0A9W6PMA6_9ACTN|nr:hypothetical protein [Kitasatospora phosalacinea]GLW58895.1 hypothetical protein Kpho01_69050 [Kitasatospora phosalacinea]
MQHFMVDAPDISTAWLRAASRLADLPDKRAYHTVVRITDPRSEDPRVRSELERLRAARKGSPLYPLETVVNTLFPTALAAVSKDHDDLVRRYRALYSRLRKAARRNIHGTYFGRLVCYPGKDSTGTPVDQLGLLIDRLRRYSGSAQWNGLYEAGTAHIDDASHSPAADDAHLADLPIRVAGSDTQTLDFPCLSHVSFQLESRTRTVHTLAYYRSHYMFDRAYGNYLALGRLNAWVAQQAGLTPGSLTVVAGVARLDCPADQVSLLQHAAQKDAMFDLAN